MKRLVHFLRNPLLMRRLAIGWTLFMLLGCLTPHEELPGVLLTWSDKIQHVLIFVFFTSLWILAGWRVVPAIAAGILFGALIEVLQYILPINRSADWLDLFADSVGAVIGAGAYFLRPKATPNQVTASGTAPVVVED